MRSRVLFGTGAWVLGAVAATAGSLLAVEQLGHGFLGQPSTELSVSAVNARLAAERADARARATAAHSLPTSSPTPTKPRQHKSKPAKSGSSPPGAGQLVVSRDGTAYAECKPGGAYLAYWTPRDGFEAEHVVQGPAAVASVTFRGTNSGVVMTVSCPAGSPVGKVKSLGWDNGGHHDE